MVTDEGPAVVPKPASQFRSRVPAANLAVPVALVPVLKTDVPLVQLIVGGGAVKSTVTAPADPVPPAPVTLVLPRPAPPALLPVGPETKSPIWLLLHEAPAPPPVAIWVVVLLSCPKVPPMPDGAPPPPPPPPPPSALDPGVCPAPPLPPGTQDAAVVVLRRTLLPAVGVGMLRLSPAPPPAPPTKRTITPFNVSELAPPAPPPPPELPEHPDCPPAPPDGLPDPPVPALVAQELVFPPPPPVPTILSTILPGATFNTAL